MPPDRCRIKKGVKAKVILLADRIILVVVTLRTLHGHAHEACGNGVDFIDDVSNPVFLGYRSPLMGIHAIAQKSRGHLLFGCGTGKQVTGQLLNDKFAVRLVLNEGLNHPVPPAPHVTVVINGIAVGVGIAGSIQPVECQPFRKVSGCKHPVYQSLPGTGRLISQKLLHLGIRGRQPAQIQRKAANQGLGSSRGRKLESFLLEPRANLMINHVANGTVFLADRCRICPVPLVLAPGLDPALQEPLLVFTQLVVGICRGHDLVRIRGPYPVNQLALLEISRNNHPHTVTIGIRACGLIQSQLGLPPLFCWSMAVKTVLGKDRANIPVEGNLLSGSRLRKKQARKACQKSKGTNQAHH